MLGLGKWLDEFDAIVVLEDDVVVAEDFWYYVCQCVDVYESNEDIAGVSLYGFSINYHCVILSYLFMLVEMMFIL